MSSLLHVEGSLLITTINSSGLHLSSNNALKRADDPYISLAKANRTQSRHNDVLSFSYFLQVGYINVPDHVERLQNLSFVFITMDGE